jgi:hypothetical protein
MKLATLGLRTKSLCVAALGATVWLEQVSDAQYDGR